MNPNPSKTYDIQTVAYTKKNGETSQRDIIVVTDARPTLLTLQVTDCNEASRSRITNLLHRHRDEMKALLKETGAEFKSFYPENLEILK